jgi:hypothetical protein
LWDFKRERKQIGKKEQICGILNGNASKKGKKIKHEKEKVKM